MIKQDLKKTNEFMNENLIEIENLAYVEEIGFLKKAIPFAPEYIKIKDFFVKSWDENGYPTCQVEDQTICPKVKLEMDLWAAESLKNKVISSPKLYDVANVQNKKDLFSDLAKILKLKSLSENDPILEIQMKEIFQ